MGFARRGGGGLRPRRLSTRQAGMVAGPESPWEEGGSREPVQG